MAKNVSFYGAMIALAFVFSYVESMLPLPTPVPGIKLGLANLVVVVTLYVMGTREAFIISIIRVLLVSLTFGNFFSMLYSLCGGVLSFGVMAICKKYHIFRVAGVSMAGGVFHNVGQIVVAMLVLQTNALVYYFPVLLVSGLVTGLLIGVVGNLMIEKLNFMNNYRKKEKDNR